MCLNKDEKTLFTASADGVVAKWDIRRLNNRIASVQWFVCDYSTNVVSIDSCKELNLVVSGSLDGRICIRMFSTGKIVKIIYPQPTIINPEEYQISFVRLSFRGYLIVIMKHINFRIDGYDYIFVYTINGELIASSVVEEKINALVIDDSGYNLITGGTSGNIMKYDILSLKSDNMLLNVDENLIGIEETLKEFLSDNAVITSLDLTAQENCQQLLIGNSKGHLFAYKFSPRLLGNKIFDTLHGLIIGK